MIPSMTEQATFQAQRAQICHHDYPWWFNTGFNLPICLPDYLTSHMSILWQPSAHAAEWSASPLEYQTWLLCLIVLELHQMKKLKSWSQLRLSIHQASCISYWYDKLINRGTHSLHMWTITMQLFNPGKGFMLLQSWSDVETLGDKNIQSVG